jgi:hypothetical protein
MDKFLGTFFAHQIAMKMFHFQTQSYGAHKAADDYLNTFATNFDKMMEVFQGEYGGFDVNKISLNVQMVDDKTIGAHLDKVIAFMRSPLEYVELPAEIAAIRDEMIAEIQKLKYLLGFK